MKANIFQISIAMLALVALSSCTDTFSEKEELLEETVKKTGGEDTDGPILVGLAQYTSGDEVYPGLVALYEDGVTEPLDSTNTDADGGFSFLTIDTGYFYVKVYEGSSLLGSSNAVLVEDSTYISLSL